MGTTLVGRDAMIAAGSYRPDHGPEMPVDVVALLDSIPGLDRRNILQKLREQMDATKTVTATFMGQITDSMEVADNPTQLKAIELGLRLHRLIGDEGQRISVGSVNIHWHGPSPAWQGIPASVDAEIVNNQLPNQQQTDSVPISTLEGTGPGPAPSTHTHSGKSDGDTRLDTSASAAATPLVQRVKRKRQVRLPVYKGDK